MITNTVTVVRSLIALKKDDSGFLPAETARVSISQMKIIIIIISIIATKGIGGKIIDVFQLNNDAPGMPYNA